jgi:hypothetical protein
MTWSVGEAALLAAVLAAGVVAANPRLRRSVVWCGRLLEVAARRSGLHADPPPAPSGRPIELIAREARRLGRRYRETRTGVSFAKAEGVRRAYDGVLAEGCAALGLPHLLAVLPCGPELDTERARVERLLHVWGMDVDDAA